MRTRRNHYVRLGAGRVGGGRGPSRKAGRGGRGPRTPEGTHSGLRQRVGTRGRGALSRAAERRRGLVPRVDGATRAQPRGGPARAQPALLWGVAAPREPPFGRERA